MEQEMKHVNRIRLLAAETVQQANSGHPGAPMGMAPMAFVLFSQIMNYDPKDPKWWNRDRFVLSNGHSVALQYVSLHLSGYEITMDDIKKFRQFESITPGHPELHVTPGVEVSTGPLGQGLSNAVGMAIAEKHLASLFNKENFAIFDNHIYVFVGDGCLQEGITSEASSLAGTLGLDNITVLYDDNNVTIDGNTQLSFTEDVLKRYEAYGWYTDRVEDGDHDIQGIHDAILRAKQIKNNKNEGTSKVHGTPLGWEQIEEVRKSFGLENDGIYNPNGGRFFIGQDTYDYYKHHYEQGIQKHQEWMNMVENYKQQYPELYSQLNRMMNGELVDNIENGFPTYTYGDKDIATRVASGKALNAYAAIADLTPSNNTQLFNDTSFSSTNPEGRYLHFGIREHAMAAISNGIAAYGGLLPFCSTFFVFTNYLAGALRMSAIQKLKVLYILTHDSIGVGEDGPTHQPIEQLNYIRSTPQIHVFRPADAVETNGAYVQYIRGKTPVVIALSRQNLPILKHSSIEDTLKGAYIVDDSKEKPNLIFVATGSEVSLCIQAKQLLPNLNIRVVSMPCQTLYDEQPITYKQSLFPAGIPVISVEAGSTFGWSKYAHVNLGIDSFGASAPAKYIFDFFHLTPKYVSETAQQVCEFYKDKTPSDLVNTFHVPHLVFDNENSEL
ncbi:hypothetical protein WA158_005657 [Blastocystis sp. Blastoise]